MIDEDNMKHHSGTKLGRRRLYGGHTFFNMEDGARHNQHYVIAYATKADFMAMTNLTSDYVSESGQDEALEFIMNKGELDTVYVADNSHKGEFVKVDPSKYGFRNNKEKVAYHEQRKAKELADREQREIMAEERRVVHLDKVAKTLYEFEERNAPWEEVVEETRDEFLRRAEIVIMTVRGK